MKTKTMILTFILVNFSICVQAETVYTILKGQTFQINTGYKATDLSQTTCGSLWKAQDIDGQNAQNTLMCNSCVNPQVLPSKTTMYTLNATLTNNSPLTLAIKIIVISDIKEIAQLKEVYFYDQTDNNQKVNFFPIRRDDNGEYYVNGNQPYWTPNNSYPIAYVSGTKMRVSSKISIDGTKSPSINILLKGTIYVKEVKLAELPSVAKTITTSSTNLIEYERKFANVSFIPNKVIYDPSCKIKWEVSFDGGTNWSEFSVSSNELYILWKKPADEVASNTFTYENYEFKHIHSIFHISCNANDGQIINSDQVLLNNIWTLFINNGGDVSSNTLLKTRNNKFLSYYKNYGTLNQSAVNMIKDIDATGQCYSFSFLFIDLQIIQGSKLVTFLNNHIGVAPKYYEPHRTLCGEVSSTANDNPIRYFLIKNWMFQGSGLDRAICNDLPYVLLSPTFDIKSNDTRLIVNGDVKKISGIAGQNQSEPLSIFGAHSIVLINGQYYDASYGKIYNSESDFTNRAVDGWMRTPKIRKESDYNLDVNGDGQINSSIIYSFSSTNQLSIWEIAFN